MKKISILFAIFAALGLAACSNDSASYMVGSKSDTAFSLFRNKAYPGADWGLELVLTNMPECQRRYTLKPVPSDNAFKAALFTRSDGSYMLSSTGSWYELRLSGCALQKVTSAPASPGDLLGSWEEREGKLSFFPSGKQ